MAGSVNKAIIIGHLGADPESRTAQNGALFVNFRVATGESWKDKTTGEKKERTEWHSVVVVGASADRPGLAGVAQRFLRKGSKVYIEGPIRTRKWQDQSGNDRYSTEIVLSGPGANLTLLDGASASGRNDYSGYAEGGGAGASGGAGGAAGAGSGGDWSQDLNDEVPF